MVLVAPLPWEFVRVQEALQGLLQGVPQGSQQEAPEGSQPVAEERSPRWASAVSLLLRSSLC